MVRGLTDKESMQALMRGPREHRQTLDRVKELAAKGARAPSELTPKETQELCGSILRQMERRGTL